LQEKSWPKIYLGDDLDPENGKIDSEIILGVQKIPVTVILNRILSLKVDYSKIGNC
jgi:hypothetical protein